MATTTYTITATNSEGESRELGTKSKKANALELARAERKATGDAVRVVTSSGNVVFEQAAKKAIKMSPRYTRVVDLPDDAIIPEGHRVAYTRARKNVALTHDPESGEYSLVNFVTGEVLESGLETTRAAGQAVKAVPLPAKADA